jgi:predicted kinase
MLVVFGGLPGTGKTTIAREVARRQGALYLRIDTIEQSIRAGVPGGEVGVAGYAVALALAQENLSVGQVVVADAVNPVPEARASWRNIAAKLSTGLIEIEIVCSDAREHRRRVEARCAAWKAAQDAAGEAPVHAADDRTRDAASDTTRHAAAGASTAGLTPPTWDEVLKRHYVPWNEDHWVIDTAFSSIDEAVAAICVRMSVPDRAGS